MTSIKKKVLLRMFGQSVMVTIASLALYCIWVGALAPACRAFASYLGFADEDDFISFVVAYIAVAVPVMLMAAFYKFTKAWYRTVKDTVELEELTEKLAKK